ncbi:MAG: cytochrome P450 [Mycobacterium sp.]
MADMSVGGGVERLLSVPANPLPYWRRLRALRHLETGLPLLRAAGGPITRIVLAPHRVMPPIVLICSPEGAHDLLGRADSRAERGETSVSHELSALLGDNLLTMSHGEWLPRRRAIQPLFTTRNVPRFAGHVAALAEEFAERWLAGAGEIDLDRECRALTLRALGLSILGVDLQGRDDIVAAVLRDAVPWAVGRAMRPVNTPRWWPTRARQRAVAASEGLHRLAADILRTCRNSPDIDAPLVRALMAATDPETGSPLSDRAICDELVLFIVAGHETIATALTYALYAVGHHRRAQQRVAAEVAELGAGPATANDIPRLGYSVQVLREAMRLCPPTAALGRMVMRDIEVDGYRVQAGTLALVSVIALHHDPELWPDPLAFNPDRFASAGPAARRRWDYLPFGAGPRRCLGDHFAMQAATVALASILRHVEIRSLRKGFPTTAPLTVIPAAPVPALIRRRVHTE